MSWRDFYSLFSQLEIAESIGGEDGFMRLLRSSRNEQFLSRLRDVRTGEMAVGSRNTKVVATEQLTTDSRRAVYCSVKDMPPRRSPPRLTRRVFDR